MKTKSFKTFLSVIVIGLFVLIAFGSGEESGSSGSSSSSSSSSENQYCAKHQRMYNPNNAWHGCPDCVKEQDQKIWRKQERKQVDYKF